MHTAADTDPPRAQQIHRLTITYRDGSIYDVLEHYRLTGLRRVAKRIGYLRPMWSGQRAFSSSISPDRVPA